MLLNQIRHFSSILPFESTIHLLANWATRPVNKVTHHTKPTNYCKPLLSYSCLFIILIITNANNPRRNAIHNNILSKLTYHLAFTHLHNHTPNQTTEYLDLRIYVPNSRCPWNYSLPPLLELAILHALLTQSGNSISKWRLLPATVGYRVVYYPQQAHPNTHTHLPA